MKGRISIAAIAGFLATPALCADANSPTPPSTPPVQLAVPPNFAKPNEPPPELEPPIECDLRASPDYVPGIDAKGRPVVPADVPTGRQVELDTQVYVETRPRTRQRQRTGVIVNLPDLGAPACVPIEQKSPN
jgi:hypothetical protein